MLAGLAVIAASCGNDGGEAPVAGPPSPEGFQYKSGEGFDNDSDKMIGRYAKTNPMMQQGQSKQADEGGTRGNEYFNGEIAKRDFAAKDYTKKAFWGSKEYAAKVYGGDTDGSRFQKGSRFNAQGARENMQSSSESGARYRTAQKQTGAARESREAGIARTSDAETDARRRSYKQPEITDWKNQRGLTVDDTRNLLGR